MDFPLPKAGSAYQPRLRRECYGELIQIDGSDHYWFEDRGSACTLLVFIDDATSTLMQLREVFCFRDERLVGAQLAFSYERKRIILAENEMTRGLPGKYVDTYAFPDGRLEVRWKGASIPYSVFDKDQRVTHAAITENKHLSAVLEFIKKEQGQRPPKKRRAGKQRTQHEPTGRKSPGPPSKMDAYSARKRVERETRAASQGSDI